jgi:hypothetical protein
MDIPFDVPDQSQQPSQEQNPAPELEKTYDTPNGDAIDRFYSQPGDDELHSTPSKMPSPTRNLQAVSASPENSLHAGHTPHPPRIYPTPTSSSLVDDERQEGSKLAQGASENAHKPDAVPPSDPTSEYKDFDTIIESEGFSMVSLDTLPSARQHGLKNNSELTKGSLKPFIQSQVRVLNHCLLPNRNFTILNSQFSTPNFRQQVRLPLPNVYLDRRQSPLNHLQRRIRKDSLDWQSWSDQELPSGMSLVILIQPRLQEKRLPTSWNLADG